MSQIHAMPMVACDELKLKDKYYMECSDFMVCQYHLYNYLYNLLFT